MRLSINKLSFPPDTLAQYDGRNANSVLCIIPPHSTTTAAGELQSFSLFLRTSIQNKTALLSERFSELRLSFRRSLFSRTISGELILKLISLLRPPAFANVVNFARFLFLFHIVFTPYIKSNIDNCDCTELSHFVPVSYSTGSISKPI